MLAPALGQLLIWTSTRRASFSAEEIRVLNKDLIRFHAPSAVGMVVFSSGDAAESAKLTRAGATAAAKRTPNGSAAGALRLSPIWLCFKSLRARSNSS